MFDKLEMRRRMAQPMSRVTEATLLGFTCANCGEKKINFTPIRRSEDGPFFCCFLCAKEYTK